MSMSWTSLNQLILDISKCVYSASEIDVHFIAVRVQTTNAYMHSMKVVENQICLGNIFGGEQLRFFFLLFFLGNPQARYIFNIIFIDNDSSELLQDTFGGGSERFRF